MAITEGDFFYPLDIQSDEQFMAVHPYVLAAWTKMENFLRDFEMYGQDAPELPLLGRAVGVYKGIPIYVGF